MLFMIDIIIPTVKADISKLVEEVKKTATGDYNLIVEQSNNSAAMNRNAGLKKAMGDFVIMVDDDISNLPQGWNGQLIEPLIKNEKIACVSARLMRPDGTIGIMCDEPYIETPLQPARNLPTSCIAFRNTHLRFDPTFVGGGWEDTDFIRRLQTNTTGSLVIDNTTQVAHANEQKNQRGDIWKKNKEYYDKKWNGEFRFFALYKTYNVKDDIWFECSRSSTEGLLNVHYLVIDSKTKWYEKIRDKSIFCLQHFIEGSFQTQDEQYVRGLHLIKAVAPLDKKVYVLIIDTDEVWDDDQLQKLIGTIINYPEYASYHSKMYTYIKSPLYRIKPQEPCQPVVAINLNMLKTDDFGARFQKIHPALFTDVYFHHFSMVRATDEEIKEKMLLSAKADGNVQIVDNWFENTWHKIPNVENFHYNKGFETCWQGIEKIGVNDLPFLARTSAFVKRMEAQI